MVPPEPKENNQWIKPEGFGRGTPDQIEERQQEEETEQISRQAQADDFIPPPRENQVAGKPGSREKRYNQFDENGPKDRSALSDRRSLAFRLQNEIEDLKAPQLEPLMSEEEIASSSDSIYTSESSYSESSQISEVSSNKQYQREQTRDEESSESSYSSYSTSNSDSILDAAFENLYEIEYTGREILDKLARSSSISLNNIDIILKGMNTLFNRAVEAKMAAFDMVEGQMQRELG